MTTTAEERAKAVWRECFDGRRSTKSAVDIITQAIRSAENDKLEEAAKKLMELGSIKAISFKVNGEALKDEHGNESFIGGSSVNDLLEKKAADIRALKKD